MPFALIFLADAPGPRGFYLRHHKFKSRQDPFLHSFSRVWEKNLTEQDICFKTHSITSVTLLEHCSLLVAASLREQNLNWIIDLFKLSCWHVDKFVQITPSLWRQNQLPWQHIESQTYPILIFWLITLKLTHKKVLLKQSLKILLNDFYFFPTRYSLSYSTILTWAVFTQDQCYSGLPYCEKTHLAPYAIKQSLSISPNRKPPSLLITNRKPCYPGNNHD